VGTPEGDIAVATSGPWPVIRQTILICLPTRQGRPRSGITSPNNSAPSTGVPRVSGRFPARGEAGVHPGRPSGSCSTGTLGAVPRPSGIVAEAAWVESGLAAVVGGAVLDPPRAAARKASRDKDWRHARHGGCSPTQSGCRQELLGRGDVPRSVTQDQPVLPVERPPTSRWSSGIGGGFNRWVHHLGRLTADAVVDTEVGQVCTAPPDWCRARPSQPLLAVEASKAERRPRLR
jgi:hypothetical protein